MQEQVIQNKRTFVFFEEYLSTKYKCTKKDISDLVGLLQLFEEEGNLDEIITGLVNSKKVITKHGGFASLGRPGKKEAPLDEEALKSAISYKDYADYFRTVSAEGYSLSLMVNKFFVSNGVAMAKYIVKFDETVINVAGNEIVPSNNINKLETLVSKHIGKPVESYEECKSDPLIKHIIDKNDSKVPISHMLDYRHEGHSVRDIRESIISGDFLPKKKDEIELVQQSIIANDDGVAIFVTNSSSNKRGVLHLTGFKYESFGFDPYMLTQAGERNLAYANLMRDGILLDFKSKDREAEFKTVMKQRQEISEWIPFVPDWFSAMASKKSKDKDLDYLTTLDIVYVGNHICPFLCKSAKDFQGMGTNGMETMHYIKSYRKFLRLLVLSSSSSIRFSVKEPDLIKYIGALARKVGLSSCSMYFQNMSRTIVQPISITRQLTSKRLEDNAFGLKIREDLEKQDVDQLEKDLNDEFFSKPSEEVLKKEKQWIGRSGSEYRKYVKKGAPPRKNLDDPNKETNQDKYHKKRSKKSGKNKDSKKGASRKKNKRKSDESKDDDSEGSKSQDKSESVRSDSQSGDERSEEVSDSQDSGDRKVKKGSRTIKKRVRSKKSKPDGKKKVSNKFGKKEEEFMKWDKTEGEKSGDDDESVSGSGSDDDDDAGDNAFFNTIIKRNKEDKENARSKKKDEGKDRDKEKVQDVDQEVPDDKKSGKVGTSAKEKFF